MSQAEIDALSGYYNGSLNRHRIACNGSLIAGGGFKLNASTGSQTYTFPTAWNGGFFPRTGCTFDANGFGNCTTGNCIDLLNRGLLYCGGAGSAAPVTKAEINFDGGTPATDDYDVSFVNGFNVAMLFAPTRYEPSYFGQNQCTVGGCAINLSSFSSPKVPSWNMLKYTSISDFIGIWDSGDYFYDSHIMTGDPDTGPNAANWTLYYGYSCPISEGYVNDSSISCADVPGGKSCKTCAGQNDNLYPFNQAGALPNSANLFFDTCPYAYAYTYNDTAALMTCQGNGSYTTNYQITVSCDLETAAPSLPNVTPISTPYSGDESGTTGTGTATGQAGPAGHASVSLQTNALGQTLAPYTVQTTTLSPLAVTLSIPQSTKSLTAGGQPISEVSVTPVSQDAIATITAGSTAPAGAVFAAGGLGVECTPSGATFDHEVSITFTMTEEHWAAALAQSGGQSQDISVHYYDTGTNSWVSLPTEVNAVTRTVTGKTNHFTLFTVFVKSAIDAVAVPAQTTHIPTSAAVVHMNTSAVPTQTIGASPESEFRVPAIAIVAAIGIIAVIIVTILLIRRWWIRRQNPALFKKYD